MPTLNEQQRARAIELMQEYLQAPGPPDGPTPVEADTERDHGRVEIIEQDLKPLVTAYLASDLPLAEFKSTIDGINKRHTHWGFKGIKGQMFFNMVVNAASEEEVDQELKSAIAVPTSEQMASSRMRTFRAFVNRVGEEWVAAGNSRHGTPKPGSIPFFLSYFWQVQDRDTWPVYYTNTVKVLTDTNLWQPSDEMAEDYVRFKQLHEELAALFTKASGKRFGLYEVEHVFWFRGDNPYQAALAGRKSGDEDTEDAPTPVEPAGQVTPATPANLPESYVPPIVAVLPGMAAHDPKLTEAAERSGQKLPAAFEKHLNAAFTILGYETKLLGQGQGRVPDGRAIATDYDYAILWDAKVRQDRYTFGTDDRAIREYISTQSRELKRRGRIRNIYYCIISSTFSEGYDELIRLLKMETDVNEVVLLQADAVVAMVDLRVRGPLETTLGPDGLQRLFTNSGVVTGSDVRQLFG